MCVCVCVCVRAFWQFSHLGRPPTPSLRGGASPTLFLTPMHYPLLPTRPDEKQAPCCNSENFKSKRFRRGSRGQGTGGRGGGGAGGWGCCHLVNHASNVMSSPTPPSTGLRHPSLEKGAGKRCSELVEVLLYVQRNRKVY